MTAPVVEGPEIAGRPASRVIVHGAARPQSTPAPATTSTAPLLAVCGLCGGAGTSTLSYLLARFVAASVDMPVLVADTGGPGAGLSEIAAVDAGRTLGEVAELHTRGVPWSAPLFAIDRDADHRGGELRVVATRPRLSTSGAPEPLERLLASVRSDGAHALVIVDCGTLQRGPDRLAVRAASHIGWVLPATAGGVRRSRGVLNALAPSYGARELVVARADGRLPAAALRSLCALAETRRAPLVLLPHLPDVGEQPGRSLPAAAVSLQAIAGVLRR